jgi:hypothetical protein
MVVRLAVRVELTADQDAELRALTTSTEVSAAAVGTRAWIVLWHAEGRMTREHRGAGRGVAADGGSVAGPVLGGRCGRGCWPRHCWPRSP